MKTLRIEDRGEVSFYEDDTIGRVRELIALQRNSHPDRLFIQILVTLPEGHYTRPSEWTDLFFRLSRDGRTVSEETLKVYTTQIRPELATFPTREYTKEQWEEIEETSPLRDGGQEWHIFGAPQQPVLPLPPRDLRIPTNMIALPAVQSLYETLHTYDASMLRVTDLPADAPDGVLRNYFPYLQPETPPNLAGLESSILNAQKELGALLKLPEAHRDAQHVSSSIVKAKWYIPLDATTIRAPRTQFEQMFYGLTMSATTPYVAYFTSGSEALRSKFYVEDPTKKQDTFLSQKLVRGWYTMTQPQRRRPTLLVYRGDSRFIFQRIAIGASDITIDIRKERGHGASLDDLKAEANTWLRSLDAVVPFLDERDIDPARWVLSDLSLHAEYAKDEPEFDLRRFPCLRSIFGLQEGVFRLLRAEPSSETVSPQVLQAFQLLSQEGASNTPEYLAGEMDLSLDEAKEILKELSSEDLNVERSLRSYPTIKFVSGKDVLIRFATNPERILTYVDILRIVLTRDTKAVADVCPRRQESVEGMTVVPQEGPPPVSEADEELMAMLGISNASAPTMTTSAAPKKSRKLKVAEEQLSTQNYFNARLQAIDPVMFGESYSGQCEKSRQVVILTPELKAQIREKAGPEYLYEDVPAKERLALSTGTAICPPYWCMTDEIPLTAAQLVPDDEDPKVLRCPICGGKVRTDDKKSTREYTVIKRETSTKRLTPYPKINKSTGAPCCYLKEKGETTKETLRVDETYIYNEDATEIPNWRGARLSEALAHGLGIKPTYETTLKPRLEFGKRDIFRIGLDRPRDLIALAKFQRADEKNKDTVKIATPAERPEEVKLCSFYSTWRGSNPIEEIDRAYTDKTLDPLHEVEYLSYVFKFAVILVDLKTNQVVCGYRRDITSATSFMIVLLVSEVTDVPSKDRRVEILGTLKRVRTKGQYVTEAHVDVGSPPLNEMAAQLVQLHKDACSVGLPTVTDALQAFNKAGIVRDHVILDPFGRKQAILAAGKAFLPFVPTTQDIPTSSDVKTITYADLKDETLLPKYADQVAFLDTIALPEFYARKWEHRNSAGRIVELETVSGLRIPVQAPKGDPVPKQTEVTETIRMKGEEMLVNDSATSNDREEMEQLDYESELYEFILYSIAKSVQADSSGRVLNDKYEDLRAAILSRDPRALDREIAAWYANEAFDDATKKPYTFLSKVRTPCGQLTETTCAKASLCGWRKGCKVRVRTSQVDRKALLTRVKTTLRTNDKQRALVLDNRFSPFFSTVLYLEMPNELITTSSA